MVFGKVYSTVIIKQSAPIKTGKMQSVSEPENRNDARVFADQGLTWRCRLRVCSDLQQRREQAPDPIQGC